MSARCTDVRALFASYAAEALPAEERRAVREHLAVCEPCRIKAAADDPTLLFACAAGAEDVSPADRARILGGVLAGLALKQTERRLSGSAGRRRERGARRKAAVAAAAAVAFFTLMLPGGLSQRAPAPSAAVKAATPGPAPGFARAASASPADAPGGATVYEIAPGSGSDEPRVVWIVDHSIDI